MNVAKKVIKTVQALDLTENDIAAFIRLGLDFKARSKWGALFTAGTIAYSLGNRAMDAYRVYLEESTFHVQIPESETRLFVHLQNELALQTATAGERTLVANVLSRREEAFLSEKSILENRDAGKKVTISAANTRPQRFVYNGVECVATYRNSSGAGQLVLVGKDGSEFSLNGADGGDGLGMLCFSFANEQDRQTFLEGLNEFINELDAYRASVYVQNAWGGFSRLKEAPLRSIDSVFLHEGQMDTLTEHVMKFVHHERRYEDLGIPWHTGILLYGPPGTGKSSLATVIANYLDQDIYNISLSSVKNDATLVELMSNVEPRSIILIEDIDVATAATTDDDAEEGVSKQGLLNLLDGVASCHGSIVIMTTNHKDKIQPELLRSGRVDLEMEIGYLQDTQMRDMCNFFIGYVPENLPFVSEDDTIVPADLVGVFRDYIDDPESAGPAVVEFIIKQKEKNVSVSHSLRD